MGCISPHFLTGKSVAEAGGPQGTKQSVGPTQSRGLSLYTECTVLMDWNRLLFLPWDFKETWGSVIPWGSMVGWSDQGYGLFDAQETH